MRKPTIAVASMLLPCTAACLAPRDKPPTPVLGSFTLTAKTPYLTGDVLFAGGGQPIQLVARLQRGNFTGSWDPAVSVAVTPYGHAATTTLPMTEAPDAGLDVFTGVVATTGLPDGPCSLVASAVGPAGASWTSPPVAVTIDNTPPAVALDFPALAQAPLQRDFAADATVRADDGSGSGIVAMGLSGAGMPRSSTTWWPAIDQAGQSGPGVLGKAHVRGADLPLYTGADGGLEGSFELTADAVDGVGNVGTATLTVPVTRLRWVVNGPNFTTSPVVGRHGRILLGTAEGGLEAYDREGTSIWSRQVSSGPLVVTPGIFEGDGGVEVAYVPLREGALVAIDLATGGPLPGFTPIAASASTSAALDARSGVLVAAVRNGAVIVADLATGRVRSTLAPAPVGRREATSVSLAGAMGAIGGSDGELMLLEDSGPGPVTLLDSVLALPGGMAAREANAAAFFAGSLWLAGLEGPFVVPDLLGGAAPLGPVSLETGAVEVGAVVDGDGDAFVAGVNGLAQLRPGGQAGSFTPFAFPPANAPTLGADGEVYLATRDGTLWAVQPGGAIGWAAPLGREPTFASAPMLDACRQTLYFAESDGRGGRLVALAIDGAGLDPRPAAWPHFRHDLQGSGNAQTVAVEDCSP